MPDYNTGFIVKSFMMALFITAIFGQINFLYKYSNNYNLQILKLTKNMIFQFLLQFNLF